MSKRMIAKKCYISAPLGTPLGILPELLSERNILWEWAKDYLYESEDATDRIAAADFVLIILNATRGDYRGVFESGIALGLGKRVLLIQTKNPTPSFDYSRFTRVNTSLSNRDALSFHLDLFLASPPTPSTLHGTKRQNLDVALDEKKASQLRHSLNSELEKRAFDAIVSAGGNTVLQPSANSDGKFRPDLLAWLGNLDPELLDPVAIEVRANSSLTDANKLDQRLWEFTRSARIQMALVITATATLQRERKISPNVLWMTIDEFEKLISNKELSSYIRRFRNLIAHGVRQ